MRHFYGDRFECFSAGTEKTFVKPQAIEALKLQGIDTQMLLSKTLDPFKDQTIDYVVTVCDNARETCPWFPANKQLIHAPFQDPSGMGETAQETLAAFCMVRDEIKAWIDKQFAR